MLFYFFKNIFTPVYQNSMNIYIYFKKIKKINFFKKTTFSTTIRKNNLSTKNDSIIYQLHVKNKNEQRQYNQSI